MRETSRRQNPGNVLNPRGNLGDFPHITSPSLIPFRSNTSNLKVPSPAVLNEALEMILASCREDNPARYVSTTLTICISLPFC